MDEYESLSTRSGSANTTAEAECLRPEPSIELVQIYLKQERACLASVVTINAMSNKDGSARRGVNA